MAELDFHSASIDQIGAAFRGEGCVLLRNCIDADNLARLKGTLDEILAGQDTIHFADWEMTARGLPHFCEYLFGDKHYTLLDSVLGGRHRVSRNTSTRRIGNSPDSKGYQQPLTPHLDAFFHRFEWTVNFWVPFQDCGRDAPSLAVVRAPVAEAQAFTGYDGRRRRSGPPPQWNFANFSNASLAVDDLRRAFGERVWAPEYAFGDAMMLSNWTLHFTHSLPEMTERRSSVELRFNARASLGEALSDVLGPSAAKMLTALRRMVPFGDAVHEPRSH
ncbi:MAG TPA: hypothetical protein VGR70_06480 [Stellaceae bacterium]|nr:hypothetical protein [Stellaceae bacterium]